MAKKVYIDGLEQHCSNSINNALELSQTCNKPVIHVYCLYTIVHFEEINGNNPHNHGHCIIHPN